MLGGCAVLAGCAGDGRQTLYERDEDARLAAERLYEGESPDALNFGRDGTGAEKRLDRGVPEGSATSPRNENNMGSSGGINPSPAVP